METTSFDLNRSIQQWRERLDQAPALRSENLDELESHLRDSVIALEARGLSKEEAFAVSCKRLGNGSVLEEEFGKVNSNAVWLDRLLWMVIGFQFWLIVLNAYGTTQMIFDTVLGWTVEGKSEVSALGLKLKVGLLSPTLFALVLFLGWRLLRRADGKAREALTSLLRKPLQLALVFFLVAAGVGFFADGVLHYWIGRAFYGAPPPLHWTDILVRLNSLLPSAAAAGFTLILARKRLRIRVT